MTTTTLTHKKTTVIVLIIFAIWSLGIGVFIQDVDAAPLTSVSDTLSDSDTSVGANHTIQFSTETGISNGSSTSIVFPTAANEFTGTSSITHADVDFASTSDWTIGNQGADGCGGSDQIGFSTSSDATTFTITLTFCSGDGASVGASTTLSVEIGTNATFGSTSANQLTNPNTTGSYEVNINGTMADSGTARVAIIDDVVVTAAVDTALTFTVAGVATSTDINGATTTIDTTGSSTTLPFGTLTVDSPVTLGQELRVSTNANNGFVVTVFQDNNLQSTSGADIDLFVDGNATSNPSAWVSPSADNSDENTWGHFGLTSEDDLNGNEFGTSSQLFVGDFTSSSPRQIFAHDGPADGSTANIGLTQIAYRIEISALQEAGDDYENTLTYICTPTF